MNRSVQMPTPSEEPVQLDLFPAELLAAQAEQDKVYDVDSCLPRPKGYRLLVALPQVEETFGETGLLKSRQTLHEEHIMSIVGLVVDMGESAYKDEKRFPLGAWCAIGDYVMFRANSGTRFKFGGVEYRIMNDDSIDATVPEPKAISRV